MALKTPEDVKDRSVLLFMTFFHGKFHFHFASCIVTHVTRCCVLVSVIPFEMWKFTFKIKIVANDAVKKDAFPHLQPTLTFRSPFCFPSTEWECSSPVCPSGNQSVSTRTRCWSLKGMCLYYSGITLANRMGWLWNPSVWTSFLCFSVSGANFPFLRSFMGLQGM